MAGPVRFQYNNTQPIEDQVSNFLKPYGGYSGAYGSNGVINAHDPKQFSQGMSDPDEGGNYKQTFNSLNPRLQNTDDGILIDGGWQQVPWVNTDNKNGMPSGENSNTGYTKPDNMGSYGNMVYDPEFGLIMPKQNYRDPHAKTDALTNAAIMMVVGGAGFGAAGAAAAAGGGATVMGQGIPALANAGIHGVQTLDNTYNPGGSKVPGLSSYAGGNVATGNNVNNSGLKTNNDEGDPLTMVDPTDPNNVGVEVPNEPDTGTGSGSGNGNGFDISGFLRGLGLGGSGGSSGIGSLLQSGLGQYFQNRNNQDYRGDINSMVNVGTGGITPDDRAGARNLVKGVYDGSISGDKIFDMVPGLKAQSDKGYSDIARQMAAHGDSDPASAARMREYTQFNNTLVSKAWNDEMNRAEKIGGYDINPGQVAAGGMNALGNIYGNNRNDILSLLALASRGGGNGQGSNSAGPGGGGSGSNPNLNNIVRGVTGAAGAGAGGGNPMDGINNIIHGPGGGPGTMTGPAGDESLGLDTNSPFGTNDYNFNFDGDFDMSQFDNIDWGSLYG